jgi:hypothetical protein
MHGQNSIQNIHDCLRRFPFSKSSSSLLVSDHRLSDTELHSHQEYTHESYITPDLVQIWLNSQVTLLFRPLCHCQLKQDQSKYWSWHWRNKNVTGVCERYFFHVNFWPKSDRHESKMEREYKWVPVITWKVACDGPASHPWGVMLLVAYCYRNQDKHHLWWAINLLGQDFTIVDENESSGSITARL